MPWTFMPICTISMSSFTHLYSMPLCTSKNLMFRLIWHLEVLSAGRFCSILSKNYIAFLPCKSAKFYSIAKLLLSIALDFIQRLSLGIKKWTLIYTLNYKELFIFGQKCKVSTIVWGYLTIPYSKFVTFRAKVDYKNVC